MAERCRACGKLLGSRAAHIPTPELAGPGERVYFCIEQQRHVVVGPTWIAEVGRSVLSLRALLRGRGEL